VSRHRVRCGSHCTPRRWHESRRLAGDGFGRHRFALPDAERFGDAGADTLGHIAQWCLRTRGRALQIPTLATLGLGHAYQLVSGQPLSGVSESDSPQGGHGAARERSTGKDTVSGHWELCGLPVDFDWGYFEARSESFPPELLQAIAQAAGTEGVLGNCHASGTEIIVQLGEHHLRSGWPIVYTSADSVLQIAAHETAFGLQRLYALCEVARKLVDPYRIGRVIARPFLGDSAATFKRTPNRHDYATPPTAATLLDVLKAAGRDVIGIGKIGDIFAMQGITDSRKASGLEALMQVSREALQDVPMAVWCSPIWSTSIRNTATAATWPAMPRHWNASTRCCLH
jgi:phosphopentomutase